MTAKSRALMDELISAAASFGGGATPARLKRLGEARLGLRMYVEGLEEELRWIPVSERLPELDQDVLAIVEDCIAIGHFYEEWGGNVYFSWVEVGAMQVATHWMPLPELPEVTE